MSDMQEVRKEVKISGIKEDNIWMELVDWAGRIRYFHVECLLLHKSTIETNRNPKKMAVIYYKGRVAVQKDKKREIRTKIFKSIPEIQKWYICDEYEDLLRTEPYNKKLRVYQ